MPLCSSAAVLLSKWNTISQTSSGFLSATQDLLAPLSATKLRETDRVLQGLLEIFETRLPR